MGGVYMKRNNRIFDIAQVAFYAAFIIVAISFIKIPMPVNFVHPGNALITVSPLLMKKEKAMLASGLGVFLFDLIHGYISGSIFIVIEAVIIVYFVDLLYKNLFKKKADFKNLFIIAFLAAVLKIILVFVKYTLKQVIIGSNITTALIFASSKMPASFFTGVVTVTLVPLLYFSLKKIFDKYEKI